MLESDMQEGRTCKIILQRAQSADIGAFLHYLYTGKLPQGRAGPCNVSEAETSNPQWSVGGLIELADMYNIPGLLKLAVGKAEESVHADNIVEVVRSMNKRKGNDAVAAAYKRLRERVGQDPVLQERVMDGI